MRYRRDEAFRFEFGEPLPIMFRIDQVNGNALKTTDGKAVMKDISLNGMKIVTSLSIPVDSQHEVNVSIQFYLNNRHYLIQGTLVWKKQRLQEYSYGVKFMADSSLKDSLLEDLKIIGKRMAYK